MMTSGVTSKYNGYGDVPPLKEDLTISHFKPPREEILPFDKSVAAMVLDTASSNPGKELFIFRDPILGRFAITGKQLGASTEYVATTLINAGVQHKDRVGLLGPNCAEYVLADYGIVRSGAAVVRLHSSFKYGDDIRHVLNKTQCKGLLYHPGPNGDYHNLVKSILPGIEHCRQAQNLNIDGVPSLRFVMVLSADPLQGIHNLDVFGLKQINSAKNIKSNDVLEQRLAVIKPEDPVSLYLTSGSTGFPKIVTISNQHFTNSTLAMEIRLKIEQGDKFLTDRPLSHIGATTAVAIVSGMTMVILDPKTAVAKNNSDFLFRVIEEEAVTHSLFFPYILSDLLDVLDTNKFDLKSIRVGLVGGQCIPRNFMEKCLQKLSGLVNGYGMTEAGPPLVLSILDDPVDTKLDYVGYPALFTEYKILDDKDNVVPVNTPGKLHVRTPLMFLKYWGDEEKTREVKAEDGWLNTNDRAVMNERGYINILGREEEVIIKASINIYPLVVEKFLLGFSKIDKVVVVGVPDDKYGEEICACMIPVPGSNMTVNEVEMYCDSNLMVEGSADGLGLRPRYFLIWESFPLNSNHKLDKKIMKTMAAKELGILL